MGSRDLADLAEARKNLPSIEQLETKLRQNGLAGGQVIISLDASGSRLVMQQIILKAIRDKISELNEHSEDSRCLYKYVDLFVGSGASALLALQYARFHLDPNDISKDNDAWAKKNSRHRPFSSYSLSKTDLKELNESMISKSSDDPRRRPKDIRVIWDLHNLEDCQVAIALQREKDQQDKDTTKAVFEPRMARTYESHNSERRQVDGILTETLPSIDKDFPLLYLPQAAMATPGVLPARKVGGRKYKSCEYPYANPVIPAINEGVLLYNRKAGLDPGRTDLGGIAAVISIGAGTKKPTPLVHRLRRVFHENEKLLGETDKAHKRAESMLHNEGKHYFRLDPKRLDGPRRSRPCELYDWTAKTRREMEGLTVSYLADPTVALKIEEIARFLVALKRLRAKSIGKELYRPQWPAEVHGQSAVQPVLELGNQSQRLRPSNRTPTWPHPSSNIFPSQDATRRQRENVTTPIRRHTVNH